MAIVRCGDCGTEHSVADSKLGKTAKCSSCGAHFKLIVSRPPEDVAADVRLPAFKEDEYELPPESEAPAAAVWKEPPSLTGHEESSPGKYVALQLIAVAFRILAALLFIVGLGASAFTLLANDGSGAMMIFAQFLGAVVVALVFWAIAEIIHLLIDVERNTSRHR